MKSMLFSLKGLDSAHHWVAAPISQVSFHDLRATFIINMLTQNVSLPKVMAIVGHTQIDTTNEYLRLAGVNVKGATEELGYQLPHENNALVLQLRPS